MSEPKQQEKIAVAILGATGVVGQRLITLLEDHPQFFVAELASQAFKEQKSYRQAVQWRSEGTFSDRIGALPLLDPKSVTSRYVISALPAEVAQQVEPLLAQRGHWVFSNASTFRMDPRVPLLIPEINLSHLALLKTQATVGKIVTNPNCSTVFLALALAPLLEHVQLERVHVVTLQAASGAGVPGVAAFDLLGNTIPFIAGEEEKIESETKKILGPSPTTPASFEVLAQVNRVPVLHGHSVQLQMLFTQPVSPSDALALYRKKNKRYPGLYELHTSADHPQPARDLTPHDSRTHIGRIKQGPNPRLLSLVAMGHNLVRGAAGAALQNLSATLAYPTTGDD